MEAIINQKPNCRGFSAEQCMLSPHIPHWRYLSPINRRCRSDHAAPQLLIPVYVSTSSSTQKSSMIEGTIHVDISSMIKCLDQETNSIQTYTSTYFLSKAHTIQPGHICMQSPSVYVCPEGISLLVPLHAKHHMLPNDLAVLIRTQAFKPKVIYSLLHARSTGTSCGTAP